MVRLTTHSLALRNFRFGLLFAVASLASARADDTPTIAPNDTLPERYSQDPSSGEYDEVWTQLSCLTAGVSASMAIYKLHGGTKWRSMSQLILNPLRPMAKGPSLSPTVEVVLKDNDRGGIVAYLQKRFPNNHLEQQAFRMPVEIGHRYRFTMSWTKDGIVTAISPDGEKIAVAAGEPIRSAALFMSGSQADFTEVALYRTEKADVCPTS